MATVYIPRLIESAEQAEALPVGMVLIQEGHYAYQKGDGAHGFDYVDGGPETAIGWTALVPIEAEEEHARNQINITHMSPPAPQQVPVLVPCPRCGLR